MQGSRVQFGDRKGQSKVNYPWRIETWKMDPATDETGKETNGQEDDNKDKDEEPVVDENEFQKCSRKGRRDACPDIHCKCGDSKHSDQCLLHKENLETELEEKSMDEKTWKISPLRTLLSTRPACFERLFNLTSVIYLWAVWHGADVWTSLIFFGKKLLSSHFYLH